VKEGRAPRYCSRNSEIDRIAGRRSLSVHKDQKSGSYYRNVATGRSSPADKLRSRALGSCLPQDILRRDRANASGQAETDQQADD
jgi:hypothetical protein